MCEKKGTGPEKVELTSGIILSDEKRYSIHMQVYEQQYLDFFEVLGAAMMLVSATLLGAEESACSFSLSDETCMKLKCTV